MKTTIKEIEMEVKLTQVDILEIVQDKFNCDFILGLIGDCQCRWVDRDIVAVLKRKGETEDE